MTGTDRIEPRTPIDPPARPAVRTEREGPRRGPGQGQGRRQPPPGTEPEAEEEEIPLPEPGRIDVIV